MPKVFQKCPSGPGPKAKPPWRALKKVVEKICKDLLTLMDEIVNRIRGSSELGRKGLKQQFDEQVKGKCGPGTWKWLTHDDEIRRNQTNLLEAIEKYEQSCGPAPSEMIDWSLRPRPGEPGGENWKGDPNAPVDPECNKGIDLKPVPAPKSDKQEKSAPVTVSASQHTSQPVGVFVVAAALLAALATAAYVLLGGPPVPPPATAGMGGVMGPGGARNNVWGGADPYLL